jgi:chemotaxis protein histidine kinase CheA
MLAPLLSATDPMQDQLNAGKVHPIVETLLNNGEAKLPATAVPFNVTDGVLRVQNVAIATDQAKLTGNAQIDLPQERITASLNIGLNPVGDALTGADPAIRLDFSGVLGSPGRVMDVTDITGYLSLRAFERERRRVEKLQSNVLEQQRLRREVSLAKFNDQEREKAAAIEAQRQAEEERLRVIAAQQAEREAADAVAKAKADAEAAAKAKADADAKAKADADAAAQAKAEADQKAATDAARKAQEQLATPPQNSLNFNTVPGLPGVQVPQ